MGYEVLFVTRIKALIVIGAHSSIKWDKSFYTKKWLKSIGWVIKLLISTPATHRTYHADTTDNGIGYYKGNFGNMFSSGISFSELPLPAVNILCLMVLAFNKQEERYAQIL